MPLVLGGSSAVAEAYSIDNSCRFNDGDSAYLHFTQGTPTDNLKWTANVWFKMGVIPPADTGYLFSAYPSSGNIYSLRFTGTDNGQLDHDNYISSAHVGRLETNRFFRDPAAWYCVTVVYDSANGVAGDRMKMYINGTEQTNFAVDTNPSSSQASIINADTVSMQIGRRSDGGYFDGYIAELAFCDGQAYSASDFGEFNTDSPTIWQPKDISGLTFGNNGCWLDFGDSADLGADVSGNGNDFTVVNLAAVDQCTDTPTNNFNTLNPLNETYSAFSEGNTTVVGTNAGDNGGSCSNLSPAAGKWYAEVKHATIVSAYPSSGVRQINNSNFNSISNGAAGFAGYNNYEVGFNGNGDLLVNNSVSSSWGSSLSADDIVQFAVDCENGAIYIGINNTWQNSGVPTSGATKTGAATAWTPGPTFQGINFGDAGYNGSTGNWNFGNPSFTLTSAEADENGYGNFEYAPPSGYLALCTKNLGSDGG